VYDVRPVPKSQSVRQHSARAVFAALKTLIAAQHATAMFRRLVQLMFRISSKRLDLVADFIRATFPSAVKPCPRR
jgi:hypothetical protein